MYSPDRLVMDGHRSRILAIKYHPLQSNIFLSGGWDDTVQIWDQRDSHSLRYSDIKGIFVDSVAKTVNAWFLLRP